MLRLLQQWRTTTTVYADILTISSILIQISHRSYSKCLVHVITHAVGLMTCQTAEMIVHKVGDSSTLWTLLVFICSVRLLNQSTKKCKVDNNGKTTIFFLFVFSFFLFFVFFALSVFLFLSPSLPLSLSLSNENFTSLYRKYIKKNALILFNAKVNPKFPTSVF